MGLASGEYKLPVVQKQSKALAVRGKIHQLEKALMALPEKDKIPPEDVTTHHFAEGIYARMMFIPAGNIIVGKIHRKETMNIMCSGKIAIATEQGNIILDRPCIVNSAPGIKKAAYAIEDTWFVNVHATDETDLGKLEEQFIVKDYDELEYIPQG